MKTQPFPVFRKLILFLFCNLLGAGVMGQMITGVWHGKISGQRVEVKIIQNGDSLTGTSYYYSSATNFRRYSIKGYFDQNTNSAIWWDDQLLPGKAGMLSTPGKVPQAAEADFNCPGGGEMFLDGKAGPKENPEKENGRVGLTKVTGAQFMDEWDYVIENYTAGTNDPTFIDSIALAAVKPRPRKTITKPVNEPLPPATPREAPPVVIASPAPPEAPGINEKFTIRKKVFTKEIPVTGAFVELRFYDNAQVDGDSISLFLDGVLIFEHIRLSEQAHVIKLAVADLKSTSELIMVAENLGSIPPNTSFMVALVGDKRYEAKLSSSENSSALIRLKKE